MTITRMLTAGVVLAFVRRRDPSRKEPVAPLLGSGGCALPEPIIPEGPGSPPESPGEEEEDPPHEGGCC